MSSKVALVFDNGEYSVIVNDTVIYTNKKIDEAYKQFEKTIKNNVGVQDTSWESISDSAKSFQLEGLEVEDTYKNMSFRNLKYFHNTGKLFYTGKGEMFPLNGGYRLFSFILKIVANKQLEDPEALLEICVKAMNSGVNYRTTEFSFILTSPAFNYGNVEYNFYTKEMHKGTSRDMEGFETFKAYVLEIIK
ncbi:hypothetical protein [Niameybacter massiliensis]|uniref:hypothetical protein n=1 Tax=Niameybacter massiliensis TaxID=1658108 RepID=UPI0006B6782F|nr:hypothetical protein [Niameybacter massiliensis]